MSFMFLCADYFRCETMMRKEKQKRYKLARMLTGSRNSVQRRKRREMHALLEIEEWGTRGSKRRIKHLVRRCGTPRDGDQADHGSVRWSKLSA